MMCLVMNKKKSFSIFQKKNTRHMFWYMVDKICKYEKDPAGIV